MKTRQWLLMSIALLCLVSATGAAPWQQEEPPTAETLVRHVRRALGRGQLERARTLASATTAPPEVKATSLALIDLYEGKDAQARTRLTPIADAGEMGDALLELGLLDMRQGKRDDGKARLSKLMQQAYDMTPESTFRMGKAARALGDYRLANTIFQRIGQLPLQQADFEATWGDTLFERHQLADALRSYRASIEADATWVPAHLGLARTIPLLADVSPAEAEAALKQAQTLAPSDPGVLLLTIEEQLAEEDRTAAAQALDKLAAVKPGTRDELAFRAALAYADGRTAEIEPFIAKALAVDPAFGRGYRILARQAALLYRSDDAVVFAKRAVELDPDDPENDADYGTYLMRVGDEKGAREALERAFKADPFNGNTYNLLLNLDTVDGFETVKSGEFIFKFAKDEAAILRAYAVPLADLAHKTFSARYGFTPEGPILVEGFFKHDDFAVRTLGLPGLQYALGACFGRVITFDTPKAQDPGDFSWQATLWHEIAHVFSLQSSKYRVPRWLTEGISVFEEHRYNKAWGRENALEFATALAMNRTFGVKGLPNAFQRPQDLGLAYFEASLLTEHLVAQNGDEGLRRLLAAYAEGAKDADAFAKAFGKTVDEVDVSFKAFVEKEYGALARAMVDPRPQAERDVPITGEVARALVAKAPGSFVAQYALGRTLLDAGDLDGAKAALERAVALAPMASGKDSPRAYLAELASKQGNAVEARKQWRELLTWDHDNVEVAKKLAALAKEGGDTESEDFALKVVADVYPYDVDAHTQLGRRALAKKDYAAALTELQAVMALGPINRAEAHADLAETYLGLDRKTEAKAEALKALEQAPTFARAQDLLLKAIGKN